MLSAEKLLKVKMNKMDKSYFLLPDSKIRNSDRTEFRDVVLILLIISASCFFLYFMKGFIQTIIPDDVFFDVEPVCKNIPDLEKLDCYPDAPVTEAECINRGCCFSVPKKMSSNVSLPPLNVPYCYYPSNYKGYEITDVKRKPTEIIILLHRIKPSGFPKDISTLRLLIKFIDNSMLRIKVNYLLLLYFYFQDFCKGCVLNYN